MTGRGAVPNRLRRSISIVRIARPNGLRHIWRFKGVIQVDGYTGFEKLTTRGDIVLAACWAHTRRKFYELHQAAGSPIAQEALRRIGALCEIERILRGQTAEERRMIRLIKGKSLVQDLKAWLEKELHRVPPRSGLAEAIRYPEGHTG